MTLSEVNALLRDQLDAAQEGNEALTSEIQQLTADGQRLRDELETREAGWKQEQQVRSIGGRCGNGDRRTNSGAYRTRMPRYCVRYRMPDMCQDEKIVDLESVIL